MIRFRLGELLADLNFRTGQRIEWQHVAEATGIHRSTLSKMLNTRGYNATTNNIELLCRFFSCQVGDVMQYVPDEQLAAPVPRTSKGAKPGTAAAKAGADVRYGKRTASPRAERKNAAD
ncbi:DNA-binding Xre family transcriptional regulator [Acidovorax delafieldii]|uniref:DNA-binding Xre family transcriptional regulator n=1 Tax=Acidovorax delafieldii TaxID=47920 RepID=A0AAJ2F0A1_ACIDE|nr:helix-turn-helix domain-containing protein [Acidovorax delafieldii]MDR6766501.1 DNA-binding Xre family transcriptional regulator [Acidovorax delafieldii]MDR6836561.1 DNA-binding Xre family transcriptional regulator [Acidovorax delafieldii]MDR7366052.1 DNA-binding Xre family transcriptional regulator [Acidovorax delafieldii]